MPRTTTHSTRGGRSCTVDSAGRFELANLPDGNLLVRYAAPGYVPESAIAEVARGRVDSTTRYLNGMPAVDGCRISSHVYYQSWPPEPLYFFRLSTDATDPDGAVDVESVWAEVPAVGLHQRLTFSPESLDYRATVWMSSLPVPHPETIVGRPALFRIADREAAVGADGASAVYRLMYDLPEPAFPLGGVDTVASDTTFYWHRFDKGYRVSYRCEVVLIVGGGPGGVVMAATTPGPADTSLTVSRSALPAGDCYWTVEAIDEYGNSSRSKEERFNVR